MRKILIGTLAALLVVCALSSVSFAASSDWTLDGMWNYVLEGSGTYQGYDATLSETGTIYMKTSRDGTTESLAGYDIYFAGTLSIPDWNDYSYKYAGTNANTFADNAYTPGDTITYTYSTTIDGTPVVFTLTGSQTEENTVTGTATLYIPSTDETNYLSFTATRTADTAAMSSWIFGGTWNYDMDGNGTYSGYTAALSEAGTIVMNTSSNSDGTETLVSYTVEYSGTLSIPDMNNYSYSYSGDNTEYFADNTYTPGETVSYSYTTAIDGTPVQFTIAGMHTAENSMMGVATLYIPSTGETNYLPFTATREADASSSSDGDVSSDSGETSDGSSGDSGTSDGSSGDSETSDGSSGGGGGGCNAGFGALALLIAAPLLYFRKKD